MTRFAGAGRRPSIILALVAGLALASGCDRHPGNPDQVETRSLEQLRADGHLVVLTRNAPTTYYIDRVGEPTGPEHDLVTAFAHHLGVEVEFRLYPTVSEILAALEAGEGDLAAAGLTDTEARRRRFRFGPSYQPVTQQVVCRRDAHVPESVDDLVGLDIAVIADSSYVERLNALRDDGHPDLAWTERADATTEQLLREVWRRELDCTIADSTIVDINRRYFPELIAPFNLSRAQPLAWALPWQRGDTADAIEAWLERYRETDQLAQWRERYYGFFELFDYVDTRVYLRRIEQRLPRYRELFVAAAGKYDLPPLLLAAQAYQESHWNPAARSPTGVRGMMMLTLNTARSVGVSNRLDARQSIFGGARYMARIRARLPDDIQGPDRMWIALAAYNVGYGHITDAQKLTRDLGLNPYHWRDLKQALPLLSDPRYYEHMKYGYARGAEPVRYVQRIREYQHVLASRTDW